MVGLYSLRRVSYLSLACMGASMPFLLGDELDEFRTVLEEGGLVQRLGHYVRGHLVGRDPHRVDFVLEEELASVIDPNFIVSPHTSMPMMADRLAMTSAARRKAFRVAIDSSCSQLETFDELGKQSIMDSCMLPSMMYDLECTFDR